MKPAKSLKPVKSLKVDVQTELQAPIATIWSRLQTVALLREVMAPIASLGMVDGAAFPVTWKEGITYRFKIYVLGFIPTGIRDLKIERIDPIRHQLQSREREPLIQRWDHLITLQAIGPSKTLYRDEIEIEAGWMTVLVWAFAQVFYRHRQRKWRRIASREAKD